MGIFDKLFGKKETSSETKKDCCSQDEVEMKKEEVVSKLEEIFGKQNVRLKSDEEVEQDNNKITVRRSFWNGDFITYKENEECNRNFLWNEESVKGVHSLSSGKGKHGISRTYYGNGQIKIESKYDNEKVIYHKCWDRNGNEIEFREEFLEWGRNIIEDEGELKKIDGIYFEGDYPFDGELWIENNNEKLGKDWIRRTSHLIVDGKIIKTEVNDIKGNVEEMKTISKKYFNTEGCEVDYDTWIGFEK